MGKEEVITEQKENIEDVSSLQLSSDEDEPITFINYAPKKSKIEYEDDSDDTDDEKNNSAQDSNIENVSSLQLSDDDEDEQITFINHAAQDSNDALQPLSQVYESAQKSQQSSFEFKTKSKEDKECNLKISTWNVNGLRAWIKKDGLD